MHPSAPFAVATLACGTIVLAGAGRLEPSLGTGALLYVGTLTNSRSAVLVYAQKGSGQQPIGQITDGVDQPFGIAVDAQRNVYVANLASGTVTVYSSRGLKLVKTLTGAGHPDAVAVGRDGTVYVDDCGYCLQPHHASSVLVYTAGSTRPSPLFTFRSKVYNTGIALDSAGNLYVAFTLVDANPPQPRGEVIAFRVGAKRPKNLQIHVGSTGALTVDSRDDLVLADQGSGSAFPAQVEVFPQGSTSPSQTIGGYAYGIALNRRNTTLWTTGAFDGYVAGFSYPAGQIVDQIQPNGVALGVATSPAP